LPFFRFEKISNFFSSAKTDGIGKNQQGKAEETIRQAVPPQMPGASARPWAQHAFPLPHCVPTATFATAPADTTSGSASVRDGNKQNSKKKSASMLWECSICDEKWVD